MGNEQAAFIRSGRFGLLDLEYIADEIEVMGKSRERSIKDRRTMIMRRLNKTPGLKPELEP